MSINGPARCVSPVGQRVFPLAPAAFVTSRATIPMQKRPFQLHRHISVVSAPVQPRRNVGPEQSLVTTIGTSNRSRVKSPDVGIHLSNSVSLPLGSKGCNARVSATAVRDTSTDAETAATRSSVGGAMPRSSTSSKPTDKEPEVSQSGRISRGNSPSKGFTWTPVQASPKIDCSNEQRYDDLGRKFEEVATLLRDLKSEVAQNRLSCAGDVAGFAKEILEQLVVEEVAKAQVRIEADLDKRFESLRTTLEWNQAGLKIEHRKAKETLHACTHAVNMLADRVGGVIAQGMQASALTPLQTTWSESTLPPWSGDGQLQQLQEHLQSMTDAGVLEQSRNFAAAHDPNTEDNAEEQTSIACQGLQAWHPEVATNASHAFSRMPDLTTLLSSGSDSLCAQQTRFAISSLSSTQESTAVASAHLGCCSVSEVGVGGGTLHAAVSSIGAVSLETSKGDGAAKVACCTSKDVVSESQAQASPDVLPVLKLSLLPTMLPTPASDAI